ncbi:unnamed protein product [Diatraea saccharalis]|uniref:Uncharacterized protein n=1 Tax=Diatraea saccharalis TaxID=40085 RepID=A0A9N9RCC7_9NEOP|nr:unnamed protein product [Diatraea saccharalis]
MEADKENINKLKLRTRIPLPVDPLPALPKHLVENKKEPKAMTERYPLKTLKSQQNLALPGPSNLHKQVDVRPKIRVDTRHVTRRAKAEVLDWDFKVFKDCVAEDDNVIIISDDEDNSKKDEYKFIVSNKQKSCLGETKDAVTPVLKSLEPNRVKNLKRSLKRPHSRELQGLSPLDKEQRKTQEKKRQKLHSCEPLNERLMSPDFCLKSVGADGNPAVIQTAVWYLDSVLATGLVQVTHLQLIAAACYWIARKLHGPGVCKFPSQPVVAQEFIGYFSWWCDQCHPGEIEVAATFLCMCGLMVDTSLCSECPSVVGAAAVYNSLLLLGKEESLTRLQICPM